MGAATRVYVQVRRIVVTTEWVEVSAITNDEAARKATCLPGVSEVVQTTYERPEGVDIQVPAWVPT
jgi:hypothetical protein